MAIKIYVIDRLNLEPSGSETSSLKVLVSGITKCASCKMPRLNPKFIDSAPKQNGVYEFDFIADCEHPDDEEEHIPTGDVLYYFNEVPADLKKIVVYAEKNMKEVLYTA
jgi:hypothetical protein